MGSNLPKKNRNDQAAADQKLCDGLAKHASLITTFLIDGQSMSLSQLTATLQGRIAASQAVATGHATWLAALDAETTERQKTRTFVSGLRQALLVAFGSQLDILADFGLTPRKVGVLTPEQKSAAAAKAKATRAARHTMGKVQKSKIKGVVAS